jgi:hypothetical protein
MRALIGEMDRIYLQTPVGGTVELNFRNILEPMSVQVNFKSSFYAFEREERSREERIKQEREARERQEKETREKQDKATREKHAKEERERQEKEAKERAANEAQERKEKISQEIKSIADDVSAIASKISQLSQQQRDLKVSSAQEKTVARMLITELGSCKGDLERKETALDNLTGLDDIQKAARKTLLSKIENLLNDIASAIRSVQISIISFDNIQAAQEAAVKQAKERQERERQAEEATAREARAAQEQSSASASSSQPAASSQAPQEAESQKTDDVPQDEGDTWDTFTNVRISQLHPEVQGPAKRFINQTQLELGIMLRVTTGFRTFAEQDALYEQGRSKKGSIVTHAKGGQSYHNYGLAIDVVEIKDRQAIWNTDWIAISKIGIRNGFEWGGNWLPPKEDKPHFQMPLGYSITALLELHKSGKWYRS